MTIIKTIKDYGKDQDTAHDDYGDTAIDRWLSMSDDGCHDNSDSDDEMDMNEDDQLLTMAIQMIFDWNSKGSERWLLRLSQWSDIKWMARCSEIKHKSRTFLNTCFGLP